MKKREDNTLWRGLLFIEKAIIMIACAGTTIVVAAACILRVFNINLIGFEEILIMIAFWLYMIGCAYGSYEKSQITADILEVMMPEGLPKGILRLLRNIIATVLGIVFLYWAYKLVLWTIEMDTRTPVFRIPVTIGQGSIFVGLFLVSFYNIVYLYDEVKLFTAKYIKKTMM
ncbi:MAG: TRAP transporter small permease subunit [Clostridia bacterium]|nr:TRAP transporter small permease subunit [Clostridia bacterium]